MEEVFKLIPDTLYLPLAVCAIAGYLYLYKRKEDKLEKILDELKIAVQQLILKDAVQDEKILNHKERLEDLEDHLKGKRIVNYDR